MIEPRIPSWVELQFEPRLVHHRSSPSTSVNMLWTLVPEKQFSDYNKFEWKFCGWKFRGSVDTIVGKQLYLRG